MSTIAWAARQSFVTYEAGFKHPVPLKGRLKTLDLSMSLVNAADREKAIAEFETNKKSSK